MKLSKKQQEIIDHIESKKAESQKNEGQLIKVYAGFYFATVDFGNGTETIEVDHMESGEWIAREASSFSKWYSEPQPTLKELKRSLGI